MAIKFKNPFKKKKETITQENVAPVTQPSVKVVDVGTKNQAITGSYKVVGGRVSRGSQSGSVTAEQVDRLATQQEAQIQTQVSSPQITEAQRIAAATNQRVNVVSQRTGIKTSQDLPPVQRDPIRSVDIGTLTQGRVGGVTFRGEGVQRGKIQVRQEGQTVQVELTPEPQSVSPSGNVSPSYNDPKYSDPLVRRTLPAGQRIKRAYGGSGLRIRGGIRVFIEGSAIIGEKIKFDKALLKIGVPESIVYKPVSTRFAENIAISTLFLTPTTGSTTQIEKSLFEVAKVKVSGITKVTGNKAITQAGFTVSKGGTITKGFVESKAALIGQIPKGDVIIAATKGRTFTRAYVFPTGKEIIIPKKTFASAELSVVRERAGLFFTRTVGKAYQKGIPNEFFKSGGVSKAVGNKIVQVGGTIMRGGQRAISFGQFKISEGTATNIFTATGRSGGLSANLGQTTSQSLKAASSSAAQSAVRSAFQTSPRQINSIAPAVSTGSISQVSISKTFQQEIPAQQTLFRTFTIQQPKTASASRSGQRSLQIVGQIPTQEQAQRQIPRQTPIERKFPRIDQRFSQLTRTIQRQQTNRTFARYSLRNQTNPPKTRFFAFPLRRSARGNYNVFVRRQGMFRQIGANISSRKAFNLGTRATQKGLSQTFKITGSRGQKFSFKAPKGYYSKKSNQGTLFIEQPKSKINTRSEKFLLNISRRRR